MPVYSFDDSFFEEYQVPTDESEWAHGPNGEYIFFEQAKSIRLDFTQLEESSKKAWSALLELGITEFRCVYDGGGDEGFAHFKSAQIEGRPVGAIDVAARLSDGDLGQTTVTSIYSPEDINQLSARERAREALDFLALDLACKLLGDGFGTGEFSMYGGIRVDMNSVEIVDEPTGHPE